MPNARIAAGFVAAATVCMLILFHAQYLSFWDYPLEGNLPLFGSSFAEPHEYARKIAETGDEYLLGVGKADITGPVVELNLMGYADPNQTGTGLRQRIYSRAFIIGEAKSTDNRFVYLVLDTQSGDTAVRDGILRGLQALGTEYQMYGQHNVAVTGTHQHSGPAAWLNYLLPQITSKGFDKQSYQAIVDGAVLSIQRAHESLTTGILTVGTTTIADANTNRSPYAYLANPEDERQKYTDDVDKNLTLLRFTRSSDGKDIGVLTWFAVHGTSMLNNNTLITGDNKGVAAYLFEKNMTESSADPEFIAGFSQANVGDTSPNVLGAFCEDGTNQACKFEDSTCGGRNEACHGRGPFPGLNDGGTKSCFEIGRRQFEGARTLYNSMTSLVGINASTAVTGSTVRALHTFAQMANYSFPHPNGTMVTACPAALGYSFAAGTSDGPGAFDFKQNSSGSPNASPVWEVVKAFVKEPSEEQKQCQGLKPVLLDVGEIHSPYEWSPNIVDIQLMRVGQLIIIVSPGEATTMAGRRWRDAIHDGAVSGQLLDSSAADPIVVLGGPANSYTHYITTEEEYGVQRYEGASTLYGPHTLNAYINLTLSNLNYLSPVSSSKPALGPEPPINTNRSLSFITGVVMDNSGFGHSFGDVTENVQNQYSRSSNAVASVKFVGANPRNNLRLEQTYAAVEKLSADGSTWTLFRNDADWELVYRWRRVSEVMGTSEVTIEWEIPDNVETGRYRIRYFGDAKSLIGTITAFEGVSATFDVI